MVALEAPVQVSDVLARLLPIRDARIHVYTMYPSDETRAALVQLEDLIEDFLDIEDVVAGLDSAANEGSSSWEDVKVRLAFD